ncbi:Abi family protein [Thiomicrospira microaerophila]|uniref:Abi family protein n=1 Tax=Thiomicrospira microaerophila TaxID=406020 RepID=UPI0005CB3F01|nr:Abi family protein [Thiomicrospira microaerophila]
MAKIPYNKPHLTYAQQRQKLVQQGMKLDLPIPQVEHYLAHFNYYRLSGYWYEYRQSNNQFRAGTLFSDIINLYKFDKDLRILLLDAIEQIEVSIRTKLAYHLGQTYGAHPILDSTLFQNQNDYATTLKKLKTEISRSREDFIVHLTGKYQEAIPPIWAVVEVMSMGQLSSWYKNLKKRQDANTIARAYQMDSQVLQSFLHHLTILRNHCAHHARVWNKSFTFTLQIPRNKPMLVINAFQNEQQPRRKIYNTLVMMAWMLNIIQPDHDWTHRLKKLLVDYPDINTQQMGFPENWQSFATWQT